MTAPEATGVPSASASGLRMEGATLVVPRSCLALPFACVVCGEAAENEPMLITYRRRRVFALAHYHPLHLYLCTTHRQKRARMLRFALFGIVTSIGLGVIGLMALPSAAIACLVVNVTSSLVGNRAERVLRLTSMNSVESRFAGASPLLVNAQPSPLSSRGHLASTFE